MPVLEMMKYNFDDITGALRVQPSPPPRRGAEGSLPSGFDGISTDSRTIKPGDLFFALKGEKFDGHKFIADVINKQAAGIVVSEPVESAEVAIFKVDNTLRALGDLASYIRSKYDIKCIGITGSNGKTTTKELIAGCLQTKFNTFKSLGNFNNLVGLPLSMSNLNESYQAAVFEMGMSVPGEITRLVQIAKPQVGVFTNIAPAHLQSMGTIDAIAIAKHELIEGLPDDGVAIINADDKILSSWIKNIKQQVITYGINEQADYRASQIMMNNDGASTFIVKGSEFTLNFPGSHNVYNAAAAIATASIFDIEPASLVPAIRNLKPYNLRSEIINIDGITIINDCYNANPESMKAAINVLADFPAFGKRVAILGDMLELGTDEVKYHEAIGEYLQMKKIDSLYAVGNLAMNYLTKFNGQLKDFYNDKDNMFDALMNKLQRGDVVLIKGSRRIALETITAKLLRKS
jgi:UDP-N-acetylmuramoyl-tripeptide--D-alanyl-D-alanine ligase